MPGPKPKSPELRQRRNKSSTATTLSTEDAPDEIPPLPKRGKWRRATIEWWEDVWKSPMAGRFLEPDRHALGRLAILVNQYDRTPTTQLAAEIRQQEARFGLTPIDRQRLQWSILPPSEKPASKAETAAATETTEDPRRVLRLVQ